MRIKSLIVALLLGVLVSHTLGAYLNRRAYTPYRPSRWVPRAFWHPEKRGINSAGLRPYLGRFHRSDPELDDQETQDIYDQIEEMAAKLAEDKPSGYWIPTQTQEFNYKESHGEGVPKVEGDDLGFE
ncbi:uncharacterized protein LOC111702030 [Eurytemora carolleeae]|uniref:uncharacterized protein LOC111702030 n=1 Tax=Eurytemora carolleeae TaxID=1294199 RepID=UPI000C76B730|nr:uncharacterized protein LOC111702030 [Eurytemora carolleeae]|eukprot:XP_023329320.1 uncharacterized protein LOC111702030 [Eurytemora affinis]